MLALRFLYGFSFGFTVAVTTSMFAEISPAEYQVRMRSIDDAED